MAFQGGGAPRFAVGTVISHSLTIVSHNMFRFLGIMVVVAIPAAVLLTLAAMLLASGARTAGLGGSLNFPSQANAALFFLIMSLVSMLAYFTIQAALTYGALQTLRGRAAGLGACLSQGISNLPRLFLAGLLLFITGGVVAGIAAAVIGGMVRGLSVGGPTTAAAVGITIGSLAVMAIVLTIVVLVWVFVPAVVVERAGPVACFRRSFDLTKGRRWPIFGIVLMLLIANVAASALTKALMQLGAPLGGAVLNVLVALFFMALSAVLSAVGYYHLRAEKEGVAIDDVVKVFD